jgi:hypothetical protein
MTKFLSKVFLMGILLGSVNGYCGNGLENLIAGCTGLTGATHTLDADTTAQNDIKVGVEIDTRITDNGDNTFTYSGSSVTMDPAFFDLNGKTLTMQKTATDSNVTTLTIGKYGKIQSGTVELSNDNIVQLEPGALVGTNTQAVTIQNGKLNLNDFINESGTLNSTNGTNLYVKLNGTVTINLFDNVVNDAGKSSVITNITSSSAAMFPNITNSSGSTVKVNNVPYLLQVEDDDGNKTYPTLAQLSTKNGLGGCTLSIQGISPVKLKSLFKSENTITCDNNYSTILSDVITNITNNTNVKKVNKVILKLSSFKQLDNTISDKTFTFGDKISLAEEEYEVPTPSPGNSVTINSTTLAGSTDIIASTTDGIATTITGVAYATYQPYSDTTAEITIKGSNITINANPNDGDDTTNIGTLKVQKDGSTCASITFGEGDFTVTQVEIAEGCTLNLSAKSQLHCTGTD